MGGSPLSSRSPRTGSAREFSRLTAASLVPNDILIYGYIYDVKSGKLVEVPEAMAAGRAS
jgi:carbonic anhydrase